MEVGVEGAEERAQVCYTTFMPEYLIELWTCWSRQR